MPKRSAVDLVDVSRLDTLALAFARAAKGKRRRPEVQAFEQNLWSELDALGAGIRSLSVEVGRFHAFRVFDPKPRLIHAPCFRERVLHHALMAHMGPVLDRSLVDDTFACREGKGALAAVYRAQRHTRRFPVFVKVDIRRYFDSISHDILLERLARRFKDPGLLALCRRIIKVYEVAPGRGLPIGALTSQHFANAYLEPLDRFLLEGLRVPGMVRYMDDIVWWSRSLEAAKANLRTVRDFVAQQLELELHPRAYVQRSAQGLSFLGFRTFPSTLRLSRRKKLRYRRAREAWERAYGLGLIDASALQRGYEGALATIAHADSLGFRRADLERRPPVDA